MSVIILTILIVAAIVWVVRSSSPLYRARRQQRQALELQRRLIELGHRQAALGERALDAAEANQDRLLMRELDQLSRRSPDDS